MLKRFSLIKQLLIVFGILAILDVALLMPLVDYNMNAIIDKQMYNKLEEVQNSYAYFHSAPPGRMVAHSFSFIYNATTGAYDFDNNDNNSNLPDNIRMMLSALSSGALQSIVNDPHHRVIKDKRTYGQQTYYYRVSKNKNMNTYIVSLLSSDYSDDLVTSMQARIIYLQYGFLALSALVLILWVLSLINPLRKIKAYVDNIKNHTESTLNVKRKDEIGIVADAIVDMKEDIERQEKAKEEMIHNISHDLKTPIALIKTYSESVKDDIYPYGTKEASMDIILENADRLEHKVKTLLYLNRLDYIGSEEKALVPFDMKELIEHIVTQMNAMNDLQIETALDHVSFLGNSDHWRIAIENIIENAFRYAKSVIKITLHKDYLEIYNDGDPIEEDRLEDLFSPYVKGVKGQFGLGLSIVSKTAEMYGYKVTAVNREVGVSFIFTKQDH